MNRIIPLAVSAVILASGLPLSSQVRELRLIPANVHWGYYDARLKPVLTIQSGETVRVETMLAGGLERVRLTGASESDIPASLKEVENAITDRGPGAHPLTGPIYVEGAEPGDVLEVRILGFEYLHNFGVSGFVPERGTLPDEFPYVRYKLIRFNVPAGTAEFRPGVTLPLAPFFGSMGVAPPPAMRRISSGPPGVHTGNLDNRELVAGSVLYMPVHAPGGLLSVGDGHALQGDGEVSLTALETSLRGTLQIFVRKGKSLLWPRAETPTHFITMGLNPDLDEAARLATREMIAFLMAEKGMSRDEAYILCSLGVHLHVTQLVDGTKGIHAMLPKALFSGRP